MNQRQAETDDKARYFSVLCFLCDGKDNKNKYKEKISLTVSGQILARDIQEEATAALFKARRGISDEDAAVFASTLKKICDNLQAYANED